MEKKMSDHKDSGWRKRQIALDIKAENARGLGLNYEPTTITFCVEPATEVLRLSVDGIWVNPDVPVDDAAKLVLAAIGDNIETLIQAAVRAEREACAKLAAATVCDTHIPTGVKIYGTVVAKAILARGNT
jgi:hypothetical protein